MDNDRFRRVQEIFQLALDAPAHERARLVFRLCGDDWDLYREVSSLLNHHSADGWDPGTDPSLKPPPPPRLEESRTLASGSERYELVDVIGEGGMGIVYLAEQTHPVRRRVALKVIKIGLDSRRGAARFEFERQALAMMDHPCIARVYEAGATEDGRLYFAMEYVAGEPITSFCDRAALTVPQRVAVFAAACDAIQHAHQKGIIHRDIKPSNILVTTQGGAPVPKIIDFGVARATNQRMAEHTMFTQMGVVVGSLRYMSPEQADCRLLEIDTRTDVYSLGAVLYELLTGEAPIDVPTIEQTGYAEVQRRIREEEPLRPSEHARNTGEGRAIAQKRGCDVATLRRQLAGDLDWIALKALEKERGRRYATAAQFAADLHRHLANQPVEAGPPTRRYRLAKFVRRNRVAVISVTAVALALILGLATSTTLFLENRASRQLAEAQRDEILRLSDSNALARLEDEARNLRPPQPEMAPAMHDWLTRAGTLAERLPLHRRTLDELRREGVAATGSDGTPTMQFADQQHEFHYLHLQKLVADLDVFVDPDPHVGTIARIRDRLAFAETVRERSIESARGAWKEAIRSIADTRESPRYGGLVMEPQVGLVPLGRDPVSGLWEFGHLRSGQPAVRGADGRLHMAEESGIVLVLLPGDCFWMGMSVEAQSDAAKPGGFALARYDEVPVHRVCLDPFFMSKYEVTQAQWLRLMGTNPSQIRPWRDYGMYVTSLRHPVENLNWQMADEFARDVGLALPTEAQWEYAARAGSTGPYTYHGRDYRGLQKTENILDESARVLARPGGWRYAPWFDGFVDSAPVGFFSPNGFGLHDMLGNVVEWTHDWYGPYELAVAPGTGERIVKGGAERVARGGAFFFFWERISCQLRLNLKPQTADRIGVRLARDLDPRTATTQAAAAPDRESR